MTGRDKEIHTFFLEYYSESKRNCVTPVRTCLLRCASSARYQLYHRHSPNKKLVMVISIIFQKEASNFAKVFNLIVMSLKDLYCRQESHQYQSILRQWHSKNWLWHSRVSMSFIQLNEAFFSQRDVRKWHFITVICLYSFSSFIFTFSFFFFLAHILYLLKLTVFPRRLHVLFWHPRATLPTNLLAHLAP